METRTFVLFFDCLIHKTQLVSNHRIAATESHFSSVILNLNLQILFQPQVRQDTENEAESRDKQGTMV